jgi:hypothetical protein
VTGYPDVSPPVVVSAYIKKEHAGALFAPALLPSFSYLAGADATELVARGVDVVLRWKGLLMIWQGYGDNQ